MEKGHTTWIQVLFTSTTCCPRSTGNLDLPETLNTVAVRDLNSGYYIGETIFITMSTQYGNPI